jgi:hypothetical protein
MKDSYMERHNNLFPIQSLELWQGFKVWRTERKGGKQSVKMCSDGGRGACLGDPCREDETEKEGMIIKSFRLGPFLGDNLEKEKKRD